MNFANIEKHLKNVEKNVTLLEEEMKEQKHIIKSMYIQLVKKQVCIEKLEKRAKDEEWFSPLLGTGIR